MTPYKIIKNGHNKELSHQTLKAFREIESNFILKKWKPSELDAGHFVEAVRRILDFELTGTYTPFSSNLPPFSDTTLKHFEQQTGHESYRLLIPRSLKAIYNVRNKRGVAHISDISPNEMDATYILYTVKWVLAELVRLKSTLSPAQTQHLIDSIVERQIPIIWKDENIERILNPRMPARSQILVLLYDKSPRTEKDLQEIIEYKNKTYFSKVIQKLHKDRHIFRHGDGNCRISPLGITEAEKIILKYQKPANLG